MSPSGTLEFLRLRLAEANAYAVPQIFADQGGHYFGKKLRVFFIEHLQ